MKRTKARGGLCDAKHPETKQECWFPDGHAGRHRTEGWLVWGGDGTVSSDDPVHHPKHYTNHPSGVECIQITEHMNFNRGNAIKYIWRAGEKGPAIEDLRKARWYLDREIARLERGT